jgi:hypothetical protein
MILNAPNNPKVFIQGCPILIFANLGSRTNLMLDRFLKVWLRHFSSLFGSHVTSQHLHHFACFPMLSHTSHAFPLASEMTELKFVFMQCKAQAMPVALAGAHSKPREFL